MLSLRWRTSIIMANCDICSDNSDEQTVIRSTLRYSRPLIKPVSNVRPCVRPYVLPQEVHFSEIWHAGRGR